MEEHKQIKKVYAKRAYKYCKWKYWTMRENQKHMRIKHTYASFMALLL